MGPDQGRWPLTLTGKVRVINDGEVWAYGPMGGGVRREYGLSMVFRVGGIDIVFITNNGQALDWRSTRHSASTQPARRPWR